jgi:hypothetical protein
MEDLNPFYFVSDGSGEIGKEVTYLSKEVNKTA